MITERQPWDANVKVAPVEEPFQWRGGGNTLIGVGSKREREEGSCRQQVQTSLSRNFKGRTEMGRQLEEGGGSRVSSFFLNLFNLFI